MNCLHFLFVFLPLQSLRKNGSKDYLEANKIESFSESEIVSEFINSVTWVSG
jgi:hypothetical protein